MVARLRPQPRLKYQPKGRSRIPLPRPGNRTPVRPRGMKRMWYGMSLTDLLSSDIYAQGTMLEKLVDGVAKELGIVWSAKQLDIPLTISGRLTRVDRVITQGSQIILVYIDGPQHTLREGQRQSDDMQNMELATMGFLVVRLAYDDLMSDPMGTVRRALMTLMWS